MMELLPPPGEIPQLKNQSVELGWDSVMASLNPKASFT